MTKARSTVAIGAALIYIAPAFSQVPFLDAYRRREQQIQLEQLRELMMLREAQQIQLEQQTWNACVSEVARVGNPINIAGQWGLVRSISGRSPRCADPSFPFLANVTF